MQLVCRPVGNARLGMGNVMVTSPPLVPTRSKRSTFEGPKPERPSEKDGHQWAGRARSWGVGVRHTLSRPTSWILLAATVIGAVIRLDVPRGIWLDEAISVSEARMPYGAMIHRLATTDVHPPLYFSLLWLSGRIIGFGDFAVRVPSIVVGTLLIPLVYLLGKEAYDRRTGAVASIITALAPFVVWYSQEARMYELLMAFAVLCLWAQLRILRRGGWYPWVLYTVASAAMIATQYFGIWQLLTQQLIFLGAIVVRWRRHERPGALLLPWLCSAVVLLLALVPIGLMMKGQFSNAQDTGQAFRGAAGASLSVYSVITNFGYTIVGFHSTSVMSHVVSLWPFGILAALLVLGRRCKPVSYLLVAMVVVPVTAMFVLGDLKESLADVRYQSTVVPILLLLIARGITAVVTSERLLVIVITVLVAVMSLALFNQQFSSANPRRYNFREALHRVNSQARPGDTILYDPVDDQLNTVIDYYSPKVKSAPLSSKPTIAPHRKVFVVTSEILMNQSDRSVLYSALGHLDYQYKHPSEHWVFPNVQVWVYR